MNAAETWSLRKHNSARSKFLEILTLASKQAPSVNMHLWVSSKPWTVPESHRWSIQNRGLNMWWSLVVPGLMIKYSNLTWNFWHTKGEKAYGIIAPNSFVLFTNSLQLSTPVSLHKTVAHHINSVGNLKNYTLTANQNNKKVRFDPSFKACFRSLPLGENFKFNKRKKYTFIQENIFKRLKTEIGRRTEPLVSNEGWSNFD